MTCEETNTVEDQIELKEWNLPVSTTEPSGVSWQQSKHWTIPKLCQVAAKAGSSENDLMDFNSNRLISGDSCSPALSAPTVNGPTTLVSMLQLTAEL